KERLIPRVSEREKTIRPFLNRRLCRSEGDERKNEREQEQEKEARNSWAMHKRRLPEANQDCEARFSARDRPLGVNRISSARHAVASYLVRVEAMIFSRSGWAY